MPKIVNHTLQKEKIAKATWSVIRKVGMDKASVRNIAEEAGLSVGALRYYFKTQTELLQFSMNLVSERVNERIYAVPQTGDLMEDVCTILYELLPLNQEKREEMEVYFEFTKKSISDPLLVEQRNEVLKEMQVGIRRCVEGLIVSGATNQDISAEVEGRRLFALIDGLAFHCLLGVITIEEVKQVVRLHIQTLCK